MIPIITLDGPSSTGKGTICNKLANYLKWNKLESGNFYRFLIYFAKKKKINLNNTNELIKFSLYIIKKFQKKSYRTWNILFKNENILNIIRGEQYAKYASKLGSNILIRKALIDSQRSFATNPGLVTDGRDMGTVIFPKAILKIYLYASIEVRSYRRFLQLRNQNKKINFYKIFYDLKIRDLRDTYRFFSPMKPAKDAILIDTTQLTVVQVFKNILELINNIKLHNYFFKK
ncbi:cytidylate kinase [Candidatus Legionella polyplacis]|uniref:(d)CMP kinase n=1 Tax=Candidatus Legionella polyplacis TaxID=2005262 RepID=UPI000C1E1B58|nr:(d)CMP kinase [Candidatus Legionella polyplacis]ATW01668.1 cytidylate kinase [Candidatus Legionella polyplacis]